MKPSTKTKLDNVFSQYIRQRDANDRGLITCISCGKIVHWKDADAGHYVNRKHMSVRYNEINVNAQCRACNRFDEGNSAGYTKGLIEKYGDGIIDRLLAARHQTLHISEAEAKELIKYFKLKIKKL